jgi:hypothetical protein
MGETVHLGTILQCCPVSNEGPSLQEELFSDRVAHEVKERELSCVAFSVFEVQTIAKFHT